ncbi:hypothetical protein SAMN06265795_10420 [Noviherbaspirillum humi]|uniref:Uncharacterized protein n=1 Tax=Noviherbaspirillum humi TaxID=1688639 RepID=A0A239FQ15_9BURK|nr:hypothetical protein [Noviherbaspirillum humi]SNS58302.1 hypothetical protein SAMN06265795_10420 [Noviherbaspirillum humi]
MWKMLVGFLAFALIALFVIMKAGDKVDMAGESGGHQSAPASSAPAEPAPAPAASAPASK